MYFRTGEKTKILTVKPCMKKKRCYCWIWTWKEYVIQTVFLLYFYYFTEVEVSNRLSTLYGSSTIVITDPVPSDLQISLITDVSLMPLCIPSSQNVSELSSSAKYVFANQEVRFEAAVTLGTNLTFSWSFNDNDSIYVISPLGMDNGCLDSLCSKSVVVSFFSWFLSEF